MTIPRAPGTVALRAPGRGVLLGAVAIIAALVIARVVTRSGGPAFDDWFFLVLSDALVVAALLWVRCRVDLVPGGVRVVNGLRSHHLHAAEVTAVDLARVGDRGDSPRPTTHLRVPIGARLAVDGVSPGYLTLYGLVPDARTRRDRLRWRAYLAQVDALADHLGVPFNAPVDGP